MLEFVGLLPDDIDPLVQNYNLSFLELTLRPDNGYLQNLPHYAEQELVVFGGLLGILKVSLSELMLRPELAVGDNRNVLVTGITALNDRIRAYDLIRPVNLRIGRIDIPIPPPQPPAFFDEIYHQPIQPQDYPDPPGIHYYRVAMVGTLGVGIYSFFQSLGTSPLLAKVEEKAVEKGAEKIAERATMKAAEIAIIRSAAI